MLDRRKQPAGLRYVVSNPLPATLLIVLMLIAVAGLGSLIIWQNYTAALRAGELRAQSSAQVVAAHIGLMAEASDQALRRIDAALGDDPIRTTADNITDISSAVGDLPIGFQYSVYDEAGRLRLSSVPEAIGISVEDREYFRRLRDGEQVVISPQLEERLSGEQVFVIARRMTRNGRFHGAASIAIPTAQMDKFWSTMELGPHSSVSVVRTDGWLVARHPALDRSIDLSDTPLFTTYLPKADSGVYHNAVSPADGLSRIVGYRKVDNWPLVATTGVERGEAMQYFWTSLGTGMALGLPLVGLLAIGTTWILYLLRTDASRRMQLEMAFERNQFLLREIHHRVKNNLQAVSSLVQLQPLDSQIKEDMRRRIAAMVAVHEQIYGSDQFDRVDLAQYAERMITDIAKGYSSDIDVDLDLDPVSIGRDQALPVGLIINELVSNAFKHAFAKRGKGRLRVSLKQQDGDIRLVVKDDGPGQMPGAETSGMGTKLINGFVQQVKAKLDIDGSDGTTATVTFRPD